MTEITCPACSSRHPIEAENGSCQAPFRCPSCLGFYFITVENGALISCEPLTESGYARWKQSQQEHKQIILD